ncbi:hypothetical protein L596_000348 [Steinernema carpocapsae]|uniref:Uncharacterized protein n=1 Tax=Steinernema carpocapsae TaxID=34508 RepID=A0A4U8UHR6_STECR|nr:hypothetical protein L596_000348 [Steinernema carpocapsae]
MTIHPKPGVYTSSESGGSEDDELEHLQQTPLYVIPKREPEVFVCGESAMHNREKMQRMGQLKKCPVQINSHRNFPCQKEPKWLTEKQQAARQAGFEEQMNHQLQTLSFNPNSPSSASSPGMIPKDCSAFILTPSSRRILTITKPVEASEGNPKLHRPSQIPAPLRLFGAQEIHGPPSSPSTCASTPPSTPGLNSLNQRDRLASDGTRKKKHRAGRAVAERTLRAKKCETEGRPKERRR